MVVRTAHEDTRFSNARLFDKLEIFFVRADPGGNFGKFESRVLTGTERVLILFRINKKLRLTDKTFLSAETGHEFI